jgi:hypothetical protein
MDAEHILIRLPADGDMLKAAMPAVAPGTGVMRRAGRGGIEGTQYKGGQFIPAALWERQKELAANAFDPLMADFKGNLQFLRGAYEQSAWIVAQDNPNAPRLPLTTIEYRMKAAIRDAYAQAFTLGKRSVGNLTAATSQELRIIEALRHDEFKYLRNFLNDMRTGGGRMAYAQRMDMYGAALREARWLGWVLGDLREGRLITWRMGPTEHCRDCLRFSDHGPYQVADFLRDVIGQGFVPQSGRLECIGFHCQCSLVDSRGATADKPAPEHPEPAPKPEREPYMPPPRSRAQQPVLMRIDMEPPAEPILPKVHVEVPEEPAAPVASLEVPINPTPVLPGTNVAQQPIRILGLPPTLWIKLDRAKVRRVRDVAGMTGGDLAAIGVLPPEQDAIRRAMVAVGAKVKG